MSFAHFEEHSSPLLKDLNMVKLEDIIEISNILFTHSTVNNNISIIFRKYFDFKEMNQQRNLLNNVSNVYSIPKGSLQLLIYKKNSRKHQ